MDSDLFGELQPSLLVYSPHAEVFGVNCILQLKASLHAGHWAVATMLQDVGQGFQQLWLEKKNRTHKINIKCV